MHENILCTSFVVSFQGKFLYILFWTHGASLFYVKYITSEKCENWYFEKDVRIRKFENHLFEKLTFLKTVLAGSAEKVSI